MQPVVTLRQAAGTIVLRVTGWTVVGARPAADQTAIFVGAPHTSAWDTPLMLAVAWQHRLRVRFLMKDEVVDGPFGPFWRLIGAIAVNRRNPGRLVEDLIGRARADRAFQLVVTPEGTRKAVKYWKSGFYRMSLATGIPLILVSPDGPTKTVTFAAPFNVTGDVRADMDRLRAFFADQHGIDPSKRTEARLRAEDDVVARAELIAASTAGS
jgi:1-acyl-sn-glycerol-3-phosphate acyltransferase